MDNGSALLNSIADGLWLEPVGPMLLLEREPPHHVFFSNLFDLLLRRQVPQVDLVSAPAPFWHDVFVPSGTLWWAFLESGLWHTIAVLVVLIIYQAWGPPKQIEKPWMARSRIFYRPDPTFPALGSRPPKMTVPRGHKTESRHSLQVPREVIARPTHLVASPDIAALTRPKQLPTSGGLTRAAPAAPLAATKGRQRKAPQLGIPVVGPPPDVKEATARRSSGLQAVAVAPAPVVGNLLKQTASWGAGRFQTVAIAPAPDVAAVSGRRGLAGPKVGAVAPPPAVQGGSLGRTDKGGDGNLLHVEVVAPAPKLPMEQGARPGTARGGLGGMGLGGASAGVVVPPPPSVQGSGSWRAGGTGSSLGSGLAAVPPPPSVDGAGRLGGPSGGGLGGGALWGGTGLSIVPPPPSVGGMGTLAGFARGDGQGGSGLAAVPPPPAVNGTAGSLNGRGTGGISGGFGSAVAPASSIEEAGGSGARGDGSSLGSSNSMAVPPAPSMEGVGGSNADQGLNLVVEELPMRIVGLAFALPSTSFSSSYEVFIAEKALRGHKELIKLVYWFLPYQTRLSEYHPDASKMYKLRVTRDHACDESLIHMTVSPTGQVYPGSRLPVDSLPLSPEGRNINLPCYRTSADDYRKAIRRH